MVAGSGLAVTVGGSPCWSQATPSWSRSSRGAYRGSDFGIMLTPAAFASLQLENADVCSLAGGALVGATSAVVLDGAELSPVVSGASLAELVGAGGALAPPLSSGTTRSDECGCCGGEVVSGAERAVAGRGVSAGVSTPVGVWSPVSVAAKEPATVLSRMRPDPTSTDTATSVSTAHSET